MFNDNLLANGYCYDDNIEDEYDDEDYEEEEEPKRRGILDLFRFKTPKEYDEEEFENSEDNEYDNQVDYNNRDTINSLSKETELAEKLQLLGSDSIRAIYNITQDMIDQMKHYITDSRKLGKILPRIQGKRVIYNKSSITLDDGTIFDIILRNVKNPEISNNEISQLEISIVINFKDDFNKTYIYGTGPFKGCTLDEAGEFLTILKNVRERYI